MFRYLLFIFFISAAHEVSANAVWNPQAPDKWQFSICETEGVSRVGEVVSSGVPLPASLAISDVKDISIVDEFGKKVQSQFRVLARWNADRNDLSAPIRWMLIHLAVDVSANKCKVFELVKGNVSEEQPSENRLQYSEDDNTIFINTGTVLFSVNKNSGEMFESIKTASGSSLLTKSSNLSANIDGQYGGLREVRSIKIEEQGPLKTVFTVDSILSFSSLGGTATGTGLVSVKNRYEFRAGMSTAIIRTSINWEGDRCAPGTLSGALMCNNKPNARLLSLMQQRFFLLSQGSLRQVSIRAEKDKTLQKYFANSTDAVSITQALRDSSSSPLRYDLRLGSINSSGNKADGAVLAAESGDGVIAVSLNHMHRYEPQSLNLTGEMLNINVLDDKMWLGPYQGVFSQIAVSALPDLEDDKIVSETWALLNHPLKAWPSPRWFAASGAVEEFPYSKLPDNMAIYDSTLLSIIDSTLVNLDKVGLSGISTFGIYPRYWGNSLHTDEIKCNDPTPLERWDEKYWCGTWTDYHNSLMAIPTWVFRSGDVRLLDELSFPGALRVLYTQIFQCAPHDSFFRCGQAPSGYGAFRSDNNSSHAYFDNLINYYWLTGDETVTETLERGAKSMRSYICRKSNNSLADSVCSATDPITDEWASVNGRVAVQWMTVYKFLASTVDRSYFNDWISTSARWLTQYFALVRSETGKPLGFTVSSGGGSKSYIKTDGVFPTSQFWMTSLYDMRLLYALILETANSAIGKPQILPSDAYVSLTNTIGYIGDTYVNGGAENVWPNAVSFAFIGSRIGGQLSSLSLPKLDCGLDKCIYPEGKAGMGALFMRSAELSGDISHIPWALNFAEYSLNSLSEQIQPLNKISGAFLNQLHAGVGRISDYENAGKKVVFAGLDQSLKAGVLETTLFGDSNVSDDVIWTSVSGPSDVVISKPSSLITNVKFSNPGMYEFSLKLKETGENDSLIVNVLDKSDPLNSSTDGLPANALPAAELFRVGFWNNDRTPRTGFVEILVDDVKRTCNSNNLHNDLSFFVKTNGKNAYNKISLNDAVAISSSCGARNYADNTQFKLKLETGSYQVVVCFSENQNSSKYCSSPLPVRVH